MIRPGSRAYHASPAGSVSLVTLFADQSVMRRKLALRQATWYSKQLPTLSDALAVVRERLCQAMAFHSSPSDADIAKGPSTLPKRLTEAACYVA